MTKTTNPVASRLKGVTLSDTLKKDLKPVPVVVDGILYNGHSTLSGPPKEGKSWVAIELACAVAGGAPAFGTQLVRRTGKVLYLCRPLSTDCETT